MVWRRKRLVQRLVGLLLLALVPACFPIEAGEASSGFVEEIYPSSDVLPENLLRFYVYFASPREPDTGAVSVSLWDEAGEEMTGVFLPTRFELWSPDRRRLTVLMDPGRVKTGLAAHEERGRVLRPGETYSLVVKEGVGAKQVWEKVFRVGKQRRTILKVENWQVKAPLSGTNEALCLKLDGIYDHHSLAYRIRVEDQEGELVAGRISLADEEREWRFSPKAVWEDQTYRITVDHRLEDLAGNRLTGLFDQPIDKGARASSESVLFFTPKTGSPCASERL